MKTSPSCNASLPDDAKFCPNCGTVIKKTEVYIYGYTEWFLLKHDVRIILNDKEVACVGRNEMIKLNINKSCMLEFRLGFRSTKCNVDPGDYIVLSINIFTGGLICAVTTENNINNLLVYHKNRIEMWYFVYVGALIIGAIAWLLASL